MAMADQSFGFIHIRYGDGRTGFNLFYCDFSVFFFFPFSLINSGFLSNQFGVVATFLTQGHIFICDEMNNILSTVTLSLK